MSATSNKPSHKKNDHLRANNLSWQAKVIIVIFAILMGVSMMMPSLAAIFGQSSGQSSQDASAETSSADSTDSSTNDSTSSIEKIDSAYSTRVDSLKKKLESDTDNLAYILNLGDTYMQWGAQVEGVATSDDEKNHASDLLNQAISYFDQYLAQKPSNAVANDRALSKFYAGQTDEATKELEELSQKDESYAPTWANLGLIYMQSNRLDDAKAAFSKAEEMDAEDEYGAKSYASQMLAYIEMQQNAQSSSSTTTNLTSDTSGTATTTSGVQGLTNTLNSINGTTL